MYHITYIKSNRGGRLNVELYHDNKMIGFYRVAEGLVKKAGYLKPIDSILIDREYGDIIEGFKIIK